MCLWTRISCPRKSASWSWSRSEMAMAWAKVATCFLSCMNEKMAGLETWASTACSFKTSCPLYGLCPQGVAKMYGEVARVGIVCLIMRILSRESIIILVNRTGTGLVNLPLIQLAGNDSPSSSQLLWVLSWYLHLLWTQSSLAGNQIFSFSEVHRHVSCWKVRLHKEWLSLLWDNHWKSFLPQEVSGL